MRVSSNECWGNEGNREAKATRAVRGKGNWASSMGGWSGIDKGFGGYIVGFE